MLLLKTEPGSCFFISVLLTAIILAHHCQASPLDLFDKSCKPQPSSVFGCNDNSTLMDIVYPADLGSMTCGGIYSIAATNPTPTVTVTSAGPSALYTLLLVDTTTVIIHYGAVNIQGSALISGLNLEQPPADIFSGYRGPSPPIFLIIFPSIRRSLANYEWILVEQMSGAREVPDIKSIFGFDYEGFLADYVGVSRITSYFSSGFCS